MAEKIRHYTAGIFFFAALFFIILVAWARPNLFVEPNYVVVQVPQGYGARAVAQLLKSKGVLHSPSFFLMLCYLRDKQHALKPGAYQLPRGRYNDCLEKIAKGQTYKIKVTFPEGWSAFQIAEQLKKHDIIGSIEDFLHEVSAQNAEGKLFPETYFFEPQMGSARVIQAMTGQLNRLWTAEFAKKAAALNLTQEQVLTVASIVERETRIDAERPIVAQVYLRRLAMGMKLDADPTVQYAVGEGRFWPERLRYKDLKITSPYNTYRQRGLPPTPICNPGLASIEAVLSPASSSYLYFVADGKGGHYFSKSFQEHQTFQKQLRRDN